MENQTQQLTYPLDFVTQQVLERFMGAREYFSVKLIPSIVIPSFGFFFGLGSEKIMLGLMILIAMDFITALFAVKKAGESIRSRNAVKTAYKIAIYGILVSAGHITEVIIPGKTYIEEAVTTFLALTELISILENVGRMGFAIPQKLLNQLESWRGDGLEDRRVIATRREDEIVIPKI